MGIKDWEETRLITHGRDHKLRIWQVSDTDMEGLSKVLPADAKKDDETRQPWLVHSMDVNALNFCAFAICQDSDQQTQPQVQLSTAGTVESEAERTPTTKALLLAAPNGLDQGGVDVFHLPSERRVSKLQGGKEANAGMVMALRIFQNKGMNRLNIAIGYEDGSVAVYAKKEQNVMPVWIWEKMMTARPHKQPVLSLDLLKSAEGFITSSADAVVAKFTIPNTKMGVVEAEKAVNTKHAGQQDLKVRSDGRVFSTAGWDKNVRVYSAKTLKELAILQWHQEGCYAVAFADVLLEIAGQNEEELVKGNVMDRMKQERDAKVHNTHWIVAGSKDGKISLWDVY